jgi:CHASE3 domain sensor protein
MHVALPTGQSTERKVAGRLLIRAVMLPAAFLFVATFILLAEVRYLVHSMRWVDQTDEVNSQIEDLQRLFIDMETGLRAYAATGSEELLQPYRDSEHQVQDRFKTITKLVSENHDLVERIGRLYQSYSDWTQYAQQGLQFRQIKGALDEAQLARQMLAGKRLMDEIRGQVREFSGAEDHLREVRLHQARATEFVVFAASSAERHHHRYGGHHRATT